jgi:AcrR family transcriptional regulator
VSETAGNRDLLLATAERLFAERGVDAVSLRAVMAAAGTSVAAVHYHFGNRDALVRALVERRSAEVAERREPYLAALEAAERPTAAGIAEAFVRPVADMVEAGHQDWVRFVYGILATRHPALEVLDETFAPAARRIGALLLRTDPGLSGVTVRFRLAEAMTTTFRVLGDVDHIGRRLTPRGGQPGDGVVVAELLALVTAMLEGPSPRTR